MNARQQTNQLLPQLNNINMIANHWAKELLTMYRHTCVKEWKGNQHLRVRKSSSKPEDSMIISSSTEILKEEDDYKGFTPDTVIFISTSTADEAIITLWGERHTPESFITLKKNKGNFSIIGEGKEHKREYVKFLPLRENGRRTILGLFVATSLVADALNKTCSKGGRISNQNSEVQSARKKGKLVKGSKVQLFGKDIFELMTMKDAHEFVVKEYEYTKSYGTFRRALKEGKLPEIKNETGVLAVSLMEI